jgi:hypothetical protein
MGECKKLNQSLPKRIEVLKILPEASIFFNGTNSLRWFVVHDIQKEQEKRNK